MVLAKGIILAGYFSNGDEESDAILDICP